MTGKRHLAEELGVTVYIPDTSSSSRGDLSMQRALRGLQDRKGLDPAAGEGVSMHAFSNHFLNASQVVSRNKLPQTWCLKVMEIYSCTVLEARSPKSRW